MVPYESVLISKSDKVLSKLVYKEIFPYKTDADCVFYLLLLV